MKGFDLFVVNGCLLLRPKNDKTRAEIARLLKEIEDVKTLDEDDETPAPEATDDLDRPRGRLAKYKRWGDNP